MKERGREREMDEGWEGREREREKGWDSRSERWIEKSHLSEEREK